MIKELRNNTIWLLLAQFTTIITSLILVLVLAKHLGPRYNGIYNYANSIVGIFGIFVDFGMSTVLIRDISRDLTKAKKYLDNIILLKIIIGMIILFFIVLSSFFIKQYKDITYIMLFLGLYNILSGFNILLRGIFRSHRKMVYEAYNVFFEKILLLIFGFIALFFYSSLLLYTIVFASTAFIGTLIAIFIVRSKFTKFSFHINYEFSKYIIKEIWPYGLSSIIVTVYFTIDQIMLGSMKPIVQVGYYALARSGTGVVTSIIGVFVGVLFPSFAEYFKNNRKQFTDLLNNSIKFMAILGIIFITEMMISSKEFVLSIFGTRYTGSIIPLEILSIATGFIFINALIGNVFGAIDKQKFLIKGLLISMIINIISNLILIQYLSAVGSAISAVLTELFIGIYAYTVLKRDVDIHFLQYTIKPIIAAAIIYIISLEFTNINIFALSISGVVVYFTILIITRDISIKFIKETLNFKKYENSN